MTIRVPALMSDDRIVVPRFILGDVEYRTDSIGRTFSALEYRAVMTLPILAELRHAYFGGSDDYKQSVLSNRGRGEWTSTLLRDGKEVIERPAEVFYNKKHGLWIAEGTPIRVELPPDGWALEYDKPTGFPSRTTENRSEAEKIFKDDTSYFYANRNGLRAVFRAFDLGVGGPFCVNAGRVLDGGLSDLGGRACSRPKQDAKHLATPRETSYVMGQAEYDTLTKLAEKSPEAADLFSKIRVQGKEY